MWKQSHTVSSDQSWSKVDRKKERRNKGLLTQPDSHFQPMPQSLQNDDAFTPASASHDWPIQSERGLGLLQDLACHLPPALVKRSLLAFKPRSTSTYQKVVLNQVHPMSCYSVNLKRCQFSITEPCAHRTTAWPDHLLDPRHTSLRRQAATQQVLWQQTQQRCSSSQTAADLHKR